MVASSPLFSRTHSWRDDITGLRALAVLPVLLFHAFPKLLQGGFFGVDIFFVISGFLISGIIFRGLVNESFSYRAFYAKRIRRILPNLTLLLAVVATAGWFCLFSPELENLGRHIYSSAAFYQNFRLLGEIGYFTEDALRKPLLHLWSLAIEEQFYIVFPIVCALIWRVWKSTNFLFLTSAFITVASLSACLLIADKNFVFYFPLTRFWELGAGILLAALETFGFYNFQRLSKTIRNGFSIVGFVSIVFAMTCYRPALYGHPGFFTLIPVIGAVLLIAAQNDSLINRLLLSWRPMVFIGLISYSLYLWHWPLLSYLYICDPQAPQWMIIAALSLSFVLATLVYFFVEEPARRTKRWSSAVVKGLLLILIAEICLGQAYRRTEGFPARTSPFFANFDAIQKIRGQGGDHRRSQFFKLEGVRIATPTPNSFPSIILAGDSHMDQYFTRAEVLSKNSGKSFGMINRAGCVMFSKNGCKKEAEVIYQLIKDKRVKRIAFAQKWFWYVTEQKKELLDGIKELKEAISSRPDIKVYILLDYPWTPEENGHQGDFDPLRHLSRFGPMPTVILPYPEDDGWERGNKFLINHLKGYVTFLESQSYVCPGQKCDLIKWYKDDDHLQPNRVKTHGVWFNPIFE